MPTRPTLRVVEGLAPPLPWTPGGSTTDSYFLRLSSRPECVSAVAFGSQADIDHVPPRQKPYDPVFQKKRPIVFDPSQRAARMDFHPVESTDTQQLWPKLGIGLGESAFIAFDMRLSPEMARRSDSDWNRHKAQQLDGPGGAAWLTIRTYYDSAYQENLRTGENWRVAEWTMTSNSGMNIVPQRLSSSENIQPMLTKFFVRANTWARIAILLTDIAAVRDYTGELSETQRFRYPDGRVMALSYWISDEDRDAVQILDRALVLQRFTAIALLRIEWDTGTDQVLGDDRYSHAWQRYLLTLRNPPADITPFLERPFSTREPS